MNGLLDHQAVCENPELQLIVAARAGNEDAIAELFRRHYASSLAIARRLLSKEDSLDAVQSAYLSAFRNFASYRGESSFKTWITRIVINQCFLHLRQPAQRQRMVALPESGEALRLLLARGLGPEELAVHAEIRRALFVALGRLPKAFSEVLTLYSIAGLSIRDTAARLGLSVAATKTRLHRARSKMRSALKAVVQKPAAARYDHRAQANPPFPG